MLVFLAEKIVACSCVVFPVVFEAVEKILFWVAELVLYFAYDQVIDEIFLIGCFVGSLQI